MKMLWIYRNLCWTLLFVRKCLSYIGYAEQGRNFWTMWSHFLPLHAPKHFFCLSKIFCCLSNIHPFAFQKSIISFFPLVQTFSFSLSVFKFCLHFRPSFQIYFFIVIFLFPFSFLVFSWARLSLILSLFYSASLTHHFSLKKFWSLQNAFVGILINS
jgi:hypothetical protein